jgi:hypothetical protein
VAEVRAGAADKIGVVTEIATRISDRSTEVLNNLATLDTELEGFQQRLAGVRSAVPTVFAVIALLITLSMVYVAYTQVEVIRLFVMRWRSLQAEPVALPQETVAVAEIDSSPGEAPPPPPEAEPPSEGPEGGDTQS